ncbi:endonuclease/exonuclease/phosphatase family protein [Allorhizocola rhizosphaerae]|uniref:endonuclease/exonuclease/phosphatase family protein n=1 Tax=Allorhizocola rhizosphaerae TaxID=1872709 RepID=UPI0013C36867|nr:endonuclease/exonuclease/phosphatase family protein [Allorhizocola rhizosphaerae]
MRRFLITSVVACVVAGVLGGPAKAAAPPSTTGQQWALLSVANGLYVAAEINDGGSHNGMLRARSASVGSWESFTLHTADKGQTATLRSVANGLYVAAEINDAGADKGMLRARSGNAGGWEQLTLVPQGSGLYALRSKANGLYVTTEVNHTGSSQAMLRARASSVGTWERYRLVPLGGASNPPGASPPGARTVSVMSWNVCSNNGACPLYRATAATIASRITSWATRSFAPDALFLQEFCEKDAKPLEYALESATGRGWDVRFAPIQHLLAGTSVKAQKICVADVNGVDRGSYGVALAVPDANVWYTSHQLTSTPAYEQRTVLCATVESWAVNFCSTHFSAGVSYDDPDGTYRVRQVSELLSAVAKPGYRAVFGGDLNLTPPDSPSGPVPDALAPVYAAHEECDQSANGGLRKGTATAGSLKLDYIFGPTSATHVCRVATENGDSDHKPVYAAITLPAS